jgi:DHA2 family multidrug resistance protein
MATSPRGIGAMASMMVVGILVRKIDARYLMAFGFGLLGASTWMLGNIDLQIGMSSVIVPNILNGFAMGFIFVPLTTVTLSRLRKQEMGNATGIYNLVRSVGGSIGIATVMAMLVRGGQSDVGLGSPMASMMARGLQGRLFSQGTDLVTAHQKALGMLYRSVQQQSALLAYADNFRLIAILAFSCIPLLLLLKKVMRHN